MNHIFLYPIVIICLIFSPSGHSATDEGENKIQDHIENIQGVYEQTIITTNFDCQTSLQNLQYPLFGLEERELTVLLMGDLLGYLSDTYGKTLTGSYIAIANGSQENKDLESYLVGRKINPDIEELYLRAKRKDIKKIMIEDSARYDALSTELTKKMTAWTPSEEFKKSLLKEVHVELKKYNYPKNPILIIRALATEKMTSAYDCSLKLALSGEPSPLTNEIHRYKAILDRKVLYKDVNQVQDGVKRWQTIHSDN